jgi:hypothetical protein
MTTLNRQQPQVSWLVRGITSSRITSALLLTVVAASIWGLGQGGFGAEQAGGLAIVNAVVLVGLGCAALGWIRPQRVGLSPPHVMLTLGFGGMLLGLGWDLWQAGVARLASLCGQTSSLTFTQGLLLHLEFLPGMHMGMLLGGLLAIPSLRLLRQHCGRYLCSLLLQNLMCSGWMLVGMTAGALVLTPWSLSGANASLPAMLGGMFAGMTWGMVVSVALYRAFFVWRSRRLAG